MLALEASEHLLDHFFDLLVGEGGSSGASGEFGHPGGREFPDQGEDRNLVLKLREGSRAPGGAKGCLSGSHNHLLWLTYHAGILHARWGSSRGYFGHSQE